MRALVLIPLLLAGVCIVRTLVGKQRLWHEMVGHPEQPRLGGSYRPLNGGQAAVSVFLTCSEAVSSKVIWPLVLHLCNPNHLEVVRYQQSSWQGQKCSFVPHYFGRRSTGALGFQLRQKPAPFLPLRCWWVYFFVYKNSHKLSMLGKKSPNSCTKKKIQSIQSMRKL